MPATTALREALNQGISSGKFADTKIILYSRRDSTGRVCRPKALYANSNVLKTVPYFSDLLFGNFAESQSKDLGDPVDEEEFAEDYGYLSDSDLDDDEDERFSTPKYTTESEVHLFDPFATPGEEKKCYKVERIEKGKVVKIPDIAFVTFKAFLMYLYTDLIQFAPFGSKENLKLQKELDFDSGDVIIQPSPKSIYRLADKYDIAPLKSLALDRIRSEVGKYDIVEESFSRFASQYDEIRSLYIQQLAFSWMEDSMEQKIRASVEEKIKSFAKGDLEHATETFSALWEIANDDGDVKAPSNTEHINELVPDMSIVRWEAVVTALYKSIQNGIFFDRKYLARHSKSGEVLKPVYLSSIIMDDKAQQLDRLVKYVKGRNPLIKDLEGDVNVESDCDGGTPGVKDRSPNAKEENEETCAVLITGSFSAWKSLFFYRCTNMISFAPLKSQGIDSRSNYIRSFTIATTPLPCSPKSIYVLANLLGIQSLCETALADIKSKITMENVVSEFFSWVTAGQKEIIEIQCDLLVSSFKGEKTIGPMKENIKQISDGSSSHRAGALNLGLQKAFELKKKRREPPGTKLQCIRNGCPLFNNQLSYSSIGISTICNQGVCNWYFTCVSCGYVRSGTYASCQGCGKKFI